MKLTLQPGQGRLSPEARETLGFNAKQVDKFFTSSEADAFLEELRVKSASTPILIAETKSKTPWYKPVLDFLQRFSHQI